MSDGRRREYSMCRGAKWNEVDQILLDFWAAIVFGLFCFCRLVKRIERLSDFVGESGWGG